MYAPRHFVETDLTALDRLAAGHPFATLVTIIEGAPFVSHLPLLYRREGQQVTLRGHWARGNPQWRHAGHATVIFHGPHAYVSPSWYPDKEIASRVPTWNYTVAHLSGALELIEDDAGLSEIVSGLSNRHEAAIGSDWRFEFEREDQRAQLRGIVGFQLRPSRIELKFKLNQNHPAGNVDSVAGALSTGNDNERGVAALMQQHLIRREQGH